MKKLISALILFSLTAPCSAAVITVDDDGPADFTNIQAAIDAASDGDTVIVAPGVYNHARFKGKAIIVRSTNPADTNVVAATICDGFGFVDEEGPDSVLAGLSIIDSGQSVYLGWYSSPVITNCIIKENWRGITCYPSSNPDISDCLISDNRSDGIYCWKSKPTVTRCTITRNRRGVYCDRSDIKVIDSTITSNSTSDDGGGIFCMSSSPLIKNCTISSNSARHGGGIYCEKYRYYNNPCEPTIMHCLITNNIASGHGGGIYGKKRDARNRIGLMLGNSIIAGNHAAGQGGGTYGWGGEINNCTIIANHSQAIPSPGGGGLAYCLEPITNSVIWGNTAGTSTGVDAQIYGGTPDVTFSCIGDDDPDDDSIPFGGAANGNIDDDPLIVNWPDDFHLGPESPCIDTGDPDFTYRPGGLDIDGEPRVMAGRIDMGADEYMVPLIEVAKPAGGEVWAAGSTHEVQWENRGVENVDLLLSKDGGASWQAIAESLAAETGAYIWQLPEKADSNQCIISAVPSVADANVVIINSGIFEINRLPNRPAEPPGQAKKGKPPKKGKAGGDCGVELGCIKWRFDTAGPVTAAVAVGKNRIYVPCEDGRVYALDKEGQLVWSYNVGSAILGSPAVGLRGTVYVGADDGRVYAIGHNGKLLWNYTTGGSIYAGPKVGPNGTVYVASTDGAVYAVAPDGTKLWSFETGSLGQLGNSILAAPAFAADGTTYITGLYDPNLYALDVNDGGIKWHCNFSTPVPVNPSRPEYGMTVRFGWPFASPTVDKSGTIYQLLLHDPNLYAIEPDDGSVIGSTNVKPACQYADDYFEDRGQYPGCDSIEAMCGQWQGFSAGQWCSHIGSNCWSAPAIASDGTIYISFDDPFLRAVDPNGTIKWVTRLGEVGGFTLTVGCDGLIYAAGDDGYMYVVDSDGAELGLFLSDGALAHPVTGPGNTLLLSDSNGTVWAIGGDDCVAQQSDGQEQKSVFEHLADLIVGLFRAAANNQTRG